MNNITLQDLLEKLKEYNPDEIEIVKKAFENIEQIEKSFESLASAFEEMFEEINKKEFDDFLEENKTGIDKQIEKLCKVTKEGI